MGGDDLLDGHEPLTIRQHEEARQQGRDLDPRHQRRDVRPLPHDHGEVQGEVGDVREGMGRIDRQRREHGEDPALEDLVEVGTVVVVELLPLREADPRHIEVGDEDVPEDAGATLRERLDARADLGELGLGREAVGRGRGGLDRELLVEGGDAHLEQLVDVLADDRDELGTLEHREGPVLGQGQDPVVEVDARELAVEEALCAGRPLRERRCVRLGRYQPAMPVRALDLRFRGLRFGGLRVVGFRSGRLRFCGVAFFGNLHTSHYPWIACRPLRILP